MIISNEQMLRRPCNDVKSIFEAKLIIDSLSKELAVANGIGLAAPQIGILSKVAIVRADGKSVDLVNAKIAAGYDEYLFKGEGCLSFPDVFINKKRYNEILVVNNMVPPFRFIATGILAVVIQHELDHLAGVLLIDGVGNVSQKKSKRR